MARRFIREEAIEYTKDGILTVPEGVTTLDYEFAFFVVRADLPRVHTLIIPKSVTLIESMRGDFSEGPLGYSGNPFAEIVVHPKNQHYASCDGVLFSKDMKTLICYPCGKPDKTYRIPDGVETIEREAFLNAEHLTSVSYPESLQHIEAGAFTGCEHLAPKASGSHRKNRKN